MPLYNVSGKMILPGGRRTVIAVSVERLYAPTVTAGATQVAAMLNEKHRKDMPKFDARITPQACRALRWEEHRPVVHCGDVDCCGDD